MNDREKVVKGLECCAFYFHERQCRKCPYNPDYKDCRSLLIQNVKEILIAQQPRVMTLEEVRAAEVVWFEQVGVCVCAIKIQNFDSGTMSFAYAHNNYTSFVNIKPKYYGKISRCWTSRPTDAQREAIPWQ